MKRMVLGITLVDSPRTTVTNAQELVDAFRAAYPTGRLMWSLNDVVLSSSDAQYVALRSYVASQVTAHGDGAALWVGYLASNAMNPTQARSWAATYLPLVATATGYTGPVTAISWHMPAPFIQWLRDTYDVRTVIGQVWSTGNVDNYWGDGSPNFPYYPSKNCTLMPAQDEANRIDVVNVDCISQGFWEAQLDSVSGRITVHPVDAVTLLRIKQITDEYLAFPGDFQYVTNVVELDWLNDTTSVDLRVYSGGQLVAKQRFKDWLAWLPGAHPDLVPVRLDEFGAAYRALYSTNSWAVVQSGANPADPTQTIHWSFTARRRVAVRKDGSTVRALDWTPYSDAYVEPVPPVNDWTLPQRVSEKTATAQQPTNPSLVIPYRELQQLYRGDPALLSYARA